MTAVLDGFLRQILQGLRQKNGHRITELIVLDFDSLPPDRQKPYGELHDELNQRFPRGNDASLSVRVKQALPSDEFGSFHSSFTESVIQYFKYLRDFATTDNLTKAQSIRQLTSQCITALGDSKYGVVMIPIVLSFSRVLGSIATNLDRNPQLLVQNASNTDGEATIGKVSFVETTANVLRDAFIKCLAGSPGTPRSMKPARDDKRSGIYLAANSCLKLLYRCQKIRNAQQMFMSIDAQSPPLSFYPAAQRVTYLYFLGRYHFANSHFYRAQKALQAAYDECHRDAVNHRRLILIHLIAASICLGRFPSSKLLMRREAQTLAKPFLQLCRLIKTGDLGGLEDYLDPTKPGNDNARWFLRRKILLQLQNRCEVLAWRSLILHVFDASATKPDGSKMPYLRMNYVVNAARWSYDRRRSQKQQASGLNPFSSSQTIGPTDDTDDKYVDADFVGAPAALAETGFDPETGGYVDDWIGPNNNPHVSSFFESLGSSKEPQPTAEEVESVFLALIQQGLLRGFVMHGAPKADGESGGAAVSRFAIPGARGDWRGVGFPDVWAVIRNRMEVDIDGGDEVPGWVKEDRIGGVGVAGMRAGGGGGGQLGGVVRLTGARPVGAG